MILRKQLEIDFQNLFCVSNFYCCWALQSLESNGVQSARQAHGVTVDINSTGEPFAVAGAFHSIASNSKENSEEHTLSHSPASVGILSYSSSNSPSKSFLRIRMRFKLQNSLQCRSPAAEPNTESAQTKQSPALRTAATSQ